MNNNHFEFPDNSLFLVTGGAGFIGSNLCETILEMGYRVRCLDNLSTGFKHNITSFENNKSFEFILGDVRDYDTCLRACDGVDFVLHQAAFGSVPRSIEMPLLYAEINIKGTLNMLEASRQNKVKKFVYASSSSVYGDEPNLPKTEGKEGNLLSPYAITKMVTEEYGKIYKTLYNLDTYGLRYFNVFGKRQNPDGMYAAVIPRFIKQLLNNEKSTIYGDGTASRDFTFIDNVVEANLKSCLCDSVYSGSVFNIASGGRVSVNELYSILTRLLSKNKNIEYELERKGDIKHSYADITKAKMILKYDPKTDIIDALKKTLEYFKSYKF